MKSQEEILAKIKEFQEDPFNDFFGVIKRDLIEYLTFENAKPFLKEEVTKEEWNKNRLESDEDAVKEIKDYMEFAWNKANNFRGISAARSMDHFTVWVWLLGDEDHFGNLRDYQFYGKDHLVKICKKYGIDHKQWDDGVRLNNEF